MVYTMAGKQGKRLCSQHLGPWVRRFSWGYLLTLVVMAGAFRFTADRGGVGSLLLFGPRWFLALPLLPLFLASIIYCRSALLPILMAAVMVVVPIMGWSIHIPSRQTDSGSALRVMACNIQNGTVDLPVLEQAIISTGADIVALQECPAQVALHLPQGWHSLQRGELLVASRFPLVEAGSFQTMHPPHRWPRDSLLATRIKTPSGNVAFNTLHLPSPRYGLLQILDRTTVLRPSRRGLLEQETRNRRDVADRVARMIAAQTEPVIVAGDFNTPVESTIYRSVWGDYANAFSLVGIGFGWTERTSVKGVPVHVRIDHVLSRGNLRPVRCQIGPDVGSDHLPVVTEYVMTAALL